MIIFLFDCAPVGMVIDAAIVAKCSDAAIMMIESGAVKRKLALEAKEKLEQQDAQSWELF